MGEKLWNQFNELNCGQYCDEYLLDSRHNHNRRTGVEMSEDNITTMTLVIGAIIGMFLFGKFVLIEDQKKEEHYKACLSVAKNVQECK